jgi:hypothetical protein
MSLININTPAAKLKRPTGLRGIFCDIRSWVDGEVVSCNQAREDQLLFDTATASFDLIAPELIEDTAIYIVDQTGGTLYPKVSNVAVTAKSIETFASLEDAAEAAMDTLHESVALLLNIDLIVDMNDAVEQLIAVKLALPDVPVIICSSTFSKNNFSLQRRAIADASLRLPCTDVSLALAIESGILNNKDRRS